MSISAERQAELVTKVLSSKSGQVYGSKDMFCIRNSQDSSVEASGFDNKMEAKFVRDLLNETRRRAAIGTKKHVSTLVVSRGAHHWRGPSGKVVK